MTNNVDDDDLDSPMLTRREAAAFCRVSLRTFERYVLPRIARVRLGGRFFFMKGDLTRWLEQQKVGSSLATRATVSTVSASRTPVVASSSRREREILSRLRAKRRGSTRRSFPAKAAQQR